MKKLLPLLGIFLVMSSLNSAAAPKPIQDNSGEKAIIDGVPAINIIERLEKHVDLLSKFNAKNKKLQVLVFGTIDRFPIFFNQNEEKYKHELINLCIKKMKKEMSLDSLFEIWKLFLESFKTVDNGLFLKEFSILIFYLYKNLMLEFDTHRITRSLSLRRPTGPIIELDSRVSISQIVEFCNKVSLLPIPEILRLLDRCYSQFLLIMQEYGLGSGGSWYEWFQEYWWVPPAIICAVIYSVYSRYVVSPSFSPHGFGGNNFSAGDNLMVLRKKV